MLPSQPPWPSRRLLQSSADSAVSNPNRILSVPPADPPSGSSGEAVLFIGALICLVICVTSLAAVARCVRSRHNRADANVDGAPSSPTSIPAADAGFFVGGGGHQHGGGAAGTSVTTTTTTTTTTKGLKKRALKVLPKLAYADAVAAAAAARGADADADGEDWWNKAEEVLSVCAICLSKFGEWEKVRVMPQCGHGFHVACVDTWLRSNSSCPSCRQPIVIDEPAPRRCRKCEVTILETVIEASSSSAAAGSSSSSRRGRGRRSRGRGFLPEQQE